MQTSTRSKRRTAALAALELCSLEGLLGGHSGAAQLARPLELVCRYPLGRAGASERCLGAVGIHLGQSHRIEPHDRLFGLDLLPAFEQELDDHFRNGRYELDLGAFERPHERKLFVTFACQYKQTCEVEMRCTAINP